MKIQNRELLENYINYLENVKNYSDHTCTAYKNDLVQYFDYLKNTNKNLFENEDFVDYLFSLELAKSTINRKLTSVNNFLLWSSKLDKYKGKTFRKSENLKTEKKLPNILTSNYINNLIDKLPTSTAKDVRNKAIIELLYSSGLRVSELVNLKINDVKNDYLSLCLDTAHLTYSGMNPCETILKYSQFVKHMHFKDIKLDISKINLQDENVFKLLSTGETTGLFQVESTGVRESLRQMKPNKFEDIIALVALYRPGPMNNIPIYNDCKNGTKKPDYIHPLLENLLKET